MARALHILSFLALGADALQIVERDAAFPKACKLSAGEGLTARLLDRAPSCAEGMKIDGAIQQFGDEIDSFLIPSAHWRVAHTSKNHMILHPVAPNLVPLFEDISRVQFAQWRDTCEGLVTASGQFIGASTQGDLTHGFMEWYSKNSAEAFVPIWSDAHRPANMSNMYLEPFCNVSSSPTSIQDCFFLPTSNCMMGAEQWERIRKQVIAPGSVTHVTISRTMIQKTKAKLGPLDIAVLWNMLFFRQNAKTRNEVARREMAWRAENPSWPAMPFSFSEKLDAPVTCAALHIRHGDKLTPYWIKAHHTIEEGFNRTLDEYLDEALKLLNVGSEARIMVMTDDADIIEASMRTKRATTFHVNQTIQSLTGLLSKNDSGNDGGLFTSYPSGGSEDMLQWLLTIRLMSACDVFVGNLNSAFTKFVYHGMCAHRLGSCPKAVTLGCWSESSEVFNVSISQPSVVQPAACT
jgi:hypothetical protein